MKKFYLFLLLTGVCYFSVQADSQVFRYGLFVASSKGYNEITLNMADKEVRSVEKLFKDYCRLSQSSFIKDPDIEELNRAFDEAAQILKENEGAFETQFFFYYFGHGLPEGLLLGNEQYRKKLLKEKLDALCAEIKFVFIDACSSEIMGEQSSLDFKTGSKGTVFITSSSLFQEAYSDVFKPILTSGLMGDADGFIPQQFSTTFFYDEILTRLNREDQDFISGLYGFQEYYDFTYSNRQAVEEVLAALGIEAIPARIHSARLYKEILPALKNNRDRDLIMNAYDFKNLCYLKKDLAPGEVERMKKILEQAGVKGDNFVTLTELFVYIRDRVAALQAVEQIPTINTNQLSRNEPVRLSFIENKIPLVLKFPGTIFINRVSEENLLERIATFFPSLNDGTPTRIALIPGKYVIIVENGDFKYRIEKEFFLDEGDIVLDKLDWSSVFAYKKEVLVNEVKEVQWVEKSLLEKKILREQKVSRVSGISTLSAMTVPLGLLLAGIYCNYSSDVLFDQYTGIKDPVEANRLNTEIRSMDTMRDNFYIAAGVSLILPATSFGVWMVSHNRYTVYKNEEEEIRHNGSE